LQQQVKHGLWPTLQGRRKGHSGFSTFFIFVKEGDDDDTKKDLSLPTYQKTIKQPSFKRLG